MSCHPRVIEWATTLQTHLPHLSKPQSKVLALWSLGLGLARSCALTAVSACLAPWLHRNANPLRQRLREFGYEAPAKRGKTRQALVVESGFAPLLAWVLRRWEGTQLALALDATPLSNRFTVLVISVVYRGCAIIRANCKGIRGEKRDKRMAGSRLLTPIWQPEDRSQ